MRNRGVGAKRVGEDGAWTAVLEREARLDGEFVYVVAASPLGRLLVAMTERGVCAVALGDRDAELEAALAKEYPHATRERVETLGPVVDATLLYLAGETSRLAVPVDVRGTAFQIRVWKALRAIPYGTTRTYSEVAAAIGRPSAVRAVARACATNPVALVVPCHRVVRQGGALGGYRWGIERKQRLLDQERDVQTRPKVRENL